MSRKKCKNHRKRQGASPARISPSRRVVQTETAPNHPIAGSEAPNLSTASDFL